MSKPRVHTFLDGIIFLADYGFMKIVTTLLPCFLVCSLFSVQTTAQAAFNAVPTWAQLELQSVTKLTATLKIPATQQHGAAVLPKGMTFKIVGFNPLDEIGVQTVLAVAPNCPANLKDLNLEMEMVSANYAIELHPGCAITVYLEFKDLNQPSFFEVAARR
jgi:hypothetical protein